MQMIDSNPILFLTVVISERVSKYLITQITLLILFDIIYFHATTFGFIFLFYARSWKLTFFSETPFSQVQVYAKYLF